MTELTPEGRFYADAVAGLLAHEHVVQLPAQHRERRHLAGSMG